MTCNLNTVELEIKEGVKKAGFQAAQQSVVQSAPVDAQEDLELDEDDELSQRLRVAAIGGSLRSQSLLNKQLGRLQKKMEHFDRQQGSEGVLGLNDFRNR